MANDDSADQSRSSRRRRSDDLEAGDEIEEGEFVAGSDDSRYVFQQRRHRVHEEGRPQIKRQRLEGDTVAAGGGEGALPSPTPSCDSDGTISDIDADNDGAAALAPFHCPVCRRAFGSVQAKSGHMRVHDLHGRQKRNKERLPVVPLISGGWGVTGKRGSVGGRSASPVSEEAVDSMATVVAEPVITEAVDSMAIVVAEPVIDPMPIAFASSTEPHPPSDDSMAIVVAADNSPDQNQIVMHPASSPQLNQGHEPAAPQPVLAQDQPAVAQGQLGAAPPQILQPAAHHVQRAAPPARDEQGWWPCKVEGCHHRYATHQGLGGHMAGHKNRQNNEAAAAGLAVSDAKPEKLHHCKHCPRVFTSGVQLGGHMRKHYEGKVIPKKRATRPNVSAGELASALAQSQLKMPPAATEVPKVSAIELATALTLSLPMPPAAMEIAQAQPAVAPAPVFVRIFGFNVVPAPPAAAAEEVPSAVTETDQSSAVSTNNIEQ
ncbi:hypothetical protein ACQ4PT_018212 [Festuca glaucescens]